MAEPQAGMSLGRLVSTDRQLRGSISPKLLIAPENEAAIYKKL